MTVRTTGVEWNQFYSDTDSWPEGAWHEGEELEVNGELVDDYDLSAVPDAAIVRVTGGVVYMSEHDEGNLSLETYFRRWRKAQSTAYFSVECHLDKAEAVKTAIRGAGGKIRS